MPVVFYLKAPSPNFDLHIGPFSICPSSPRVEVESHVCGCSLPRYPDPWGEGSQPFDDGVFLGIRQILLCKDENVVHSLEIEYVRNGVSFWSERHGGLGGDTINRITFDPDDEFLTRITGFHYPISGEERYEAVRSLTVCSNKRKYGTLGEEGGTFFSSPILSGAIRGLFGRCGKHLKAIGVHMDFF